jgi:excisionase family DNA binding protein
MTNRLEAAVRELVAALREEAGAAAVPAVPDQLLSVEAAAHALGVKRTRIYQELQSGRLRSIRIGRRRLIPSSAIAERVEAATAIYGDGQEVPSASATA